MQISRSQSELDAIVAEALRTTQMPVGILTFLGGEGETVVSSRGWNISTLAAGFGFASRIADATDIVVIGDATRDPRFAAHPFVTGHPNIRFVAGAPVMDGGRMVGALCVFDRHPRQLATDQVVALRLLARQVSRELEVDRKVGELEERFREFFEQTDDLVMSINSHGLLVHFNQTVSNTLGLTPEQLQRQPLEAFVDERSREEFRRSLARVFECGEPQVIETVFVTSSGRRITVEGSFRPRLLDGTAVIVRVIFRDISDRKAFEADLGNARDAALEAGRLKSQFLTNVSHEIRTPMNGIVGMIDLLAATSLTAEQRDFASQARESAEQLLSIVNNILYVSNVEAAGLAATNVDFDLYRTLGRVVEVMKVAALGKDVDVAFEYDPAIPAVLRGQQSKIRQIITNLLENAVKFTESGTVRLRVSQQTETETHRVIRFEVRDTGIGIADEDRLLLFERFSQVEGATTRRYQGTGLGLATARHLVETLGGLIDVDSTPGKGSTFWFSIPFPKQVHGRNPIASSDLDFKGKRVLLLDRVPTNAKVVRHYLQDVWQMRVEVAASMAEAQRVLQIAALADPVRVVLYDAAADTDVLAFARAIRTNPAFAATSLVFLAGSTDVVNRTQLRDAGISAYVAKPAGQNELFDAMAVALAHDAIPMARAVEQPVQDRPKAAPLTPAQRKNIRVLLAEDNFLNAKLTMQQLQKLGYEADSVPNGQEAIEAAEKKAYDVILMDCQMPIVDGYQATMELRRRERERDGRRLHIIAMTANALSGDREKCLAAGMDDYLSKPTRGEDLDAALASAVTPR